METNKESSVDGRILELQNRVFKLEQDADEDRFIFRFYQILVFALVIAFLFLATTRTARAETWTKSEVALESAWYVVHGIDWLTTRDLPNHYDEGLYETNFALGRYPSKSKIDVYMGAWCLLHPIITDALPRKADFMWIDGAEWNPRAVWQHGTIGVSGFAGGNNLVLGLHFNFK